MIKNVKLKVVGVSFANEDGVNRQDILGMVTSSTQITLMREPDNAYDRNAIAVYANLLGTEQRVGYIGKDYASILANEMDQGMKLSAVVAEIDTYKNTRYLHLMVNEVI